MRNLHSIIENQAMIRELFEIGAVLAALTLGSIAIATAGDFTGQASIIDGDTLEIHGTRIRLWGSRCGKQPALSRGGQLAVSVRCEGGERSGCVYCKTAGELPADLAG
jgi:endonuclease YncB( thermonuclease family)